MSGLLLVLVALILALELLSVFPPFWRCVDTVLRYRLDAQARDAEFSRGYSVGKSDGRYIERKLRGNEMER